MSIAKKVIVFTELFVLFSVIGSSIAMAYAEFSEENKPIPLPTDHKLIHKDIVNQTPNGHKSGFLLSPVGLSHLKHNSVADVYASASMSTPTSYDLRILKRVTLW